MQGENEAQVVGQVGEQVELGRAGVRKERGEPVLAKNLEGGVANGPGGHRRSILEMI